jgi:hypothetical protein
VELNAKLEDGATLRVHLQRMAVNSGGRVVDPRLVPAEIPLEVSAVWGAFLSLTLSRRSGMGLSPLTLVDIEAWSRMNGVQLTPWELDCLLEVDRATLLAVHRQQSKGKPHES